MIPQNIKSRANSFKEIGYIDKLINDLKVMRDEMEVQNDTKENKM